MCRARFRAASQGSPTVVQISCCVPRKHGCQPQWEWAMLQDVGSNPASMQAGKIVDCYACVLGSCRQPRDTAQSNVQAWLTGIDTWIALPRAAWPDHWIHEDGTPRVQSTCGTDVASIVWAFGRGYFLGATL